MIESFRNALKESKAELRSLVLKRDEINYRIDGIQTAIHALANMLDDPNERLAELAEMNDIVGPRGLTEAVSSVVRSSVTGLTAVQIRDFLEALKFDLSKYSNALAAIHTTLRRLENSKKIRTDKTEDGETAYVWCEEAKRLSARERAFRKAASRRPIGTK